MIRLNYKTEPRRIVALTRGRQHGPITRLMSPSDLGEQLKPFVFLDRIDTLGIDKPRMEGYGLHPHSGIATLTWLFEGQVNYEDNVGRRGQISAGHMEWLHAGGGAWHGGNLGDDDHRVRGFQLWIALPPELEQSAAESRYLPPTQLERHGPATVLLGRIGDAISPLHPPSPMTYVSVRLRAGEHWRYEPPAGHTVAWAAVSAGHLLTPQWVRAGELAVFEESDAPIDFRTAADCEFVFGSAAKHRHDLVLGYYSVHTSDAALREGEARIVSIGDTLRAAGRLA